MEQSTKSRRCHTQMTFSHDYRAHLHVSVATLATQSVRSAIHSIHLAATQLIGDLTPQNHHCYSNAWQNLTHPPSVDQTRLAVLYFNFLHSEARQIIWKLLE